MSADSHSVEKCETRAVRDLLPIVTDTELLSTRGVYVEPADDGTGDIVILAADRLGEHNFPGSDVYRGPVLGEDERDADRAPSLQDDGLTVGDVLIVLSRRRARRLVVGLEEALDRSTDPAPLIEKEKHR